MKMLYGYAPYLDNIHTHALAAAVFLFLIMKTLYFMVQSVTVPQGGVRERSSAVGLCLESITVLYTSDIKKVLNVSW